MEGHEPVPDAVCWRNNRHSEQSSWNSGMPSTALELFTSVADPRCLSWILIFIHPGSNNSTRGKLFLSTIFCSQKNHEIVNNFIFEQLKNICYSQNTTNHSTFYPKNCHLAIKNMSLWSGSGIQKKNILDPGSRVKKAPDPRSGSAALLLTSFYSLTCRYVETGV